MALSVEHIHGSYGDVSGKQEQHDLRSNIWHIVVYRALQGGVVSMIHSASFFDSMLR